MKKQTFNSLVSGTVALLVVVVSIPLTTQALFRSTPYYPNRPREEMEDMRTQARKDRAALRQDIRGYYDALRVYQDLLNTERDGKNVDAGTLVKPDINDPSTWDFYLNRDKEPTHAAARAKVKPADFKSLSEADQRRVRTYVKTGDCSDRLPPGLRELCLDLMKKTTARYRSPRGFTNDLAGSRPHSKAPAGIDLLRAIRLRTGSVENPQADTSPIRTSAPTR